MVVLRENDSLSDSIGRKFVYLRLSLTDACNFSCQYCLPNGFKRESCEPLLTINEIENLVKAFSELGFIKVRLTGGEPTLRKDIVEIVKKVSTTPGIETVAITTNGYRLENIVEDLYASGLNAINISLDSLNQKRFEEITGSDHFDRVYRGIEKSLKIGIKKIKLNVVLLNNYLEKDFDSFLTFVRENKISVRFIELMQTGENLEYFKKEYYSGDLFRELIIKNGWRELSKEVSSGPAKEFIHENYLGKIGIISPYSKDFCINCNRLRVSSRGALKLCLFGDGEYSLREYLKSPNQNEELKAKICDLIGIKLPAHRLHEGIYGTTQHLASIGG